MFETRYQKNDLAIAHCLRSAVSDSTTAVSNQHGTLSLDLVEHLSFEFRARMNRCCSQDLGVIWIAMLDLKLG